ncbi:MAG: carboxylating nicotinate-nucleotide diphosphorylase [Proteobacteria bacterium]|nr:carboxylating nicotinate-nucleotide diphosphorylase [Pseudomonadota bacterium]
MSNLNNNIAALARTQAQQALLEDVGSGDLCAPLLSTEVTTAQLICRQAAVLCGQLWFEECFRLQDENAVFKWSVAEGDDLRIDDSSDSIDNIICQITATATALLAGERSAINFLQTLSATATVARQWQRAAGDNVKIMDTRKTIPLLRQAQKYAVRIGGAHNQRYGLYDEILIKENHIRAGGGIAATLKKAQQLTATAPQIEVRNNDELQQAVAAGATRILLDNFSLAATKAAVASVPATIEIEASGNVQLENIAALVACGVDRISIGALTKNIQAVDFSLQVNDNE